MHRNQGERKGQMSMSKCARESNYDGQTGGIGASRNRGRKPSLLKFL